MVVTVATQLALEIALDVFITTAEPFSRKNKLFLRADKSFMSTDKSFSRTDK